MKSFFEFVREQGVVGLVIGFILGTSVSQVVNSLVEDIINPLLGIFLGKAQGLTSFVLEIAGSEIRIGNFISVLLDFLFITLFVFIVFKKLGLETLDKKGLSTIKNKIKLGK